MINCVQLANGTFHIFNASPGRHPSSRYLFLGRERALWSQVGGVPGGEGPSPVLPCLLGQDCAREGIAAATFSLALYPPRLILPQAHSHTAGTEEGCLVAPACLGQPLYKRVLKLAGSGSAPQYSENASTFPPLISVPHLQETVEERRIVFLSTGTPPGPGRMAPRHPIALKVRWRSGRGGRGHQQVMECRGLWP